jgi:hypothetical protein
MGSLDLNTFFWLAEYNQQVPCAGNPSIPTKIIARLGSIIFRASKTEAVGQTQFGVANIGNAGAAAENLGRNDLRIARHIVVGWTNHTQILVTGTVAAAMMITARALRPDEKARARPTWKSAETVKVAQRKL